MATTSSAFVKPQPHIRFISWGCALEWAQHEGFPFTTKNGLMVAFHRMGGQTGKKARSPHKNIPVPVDQFMQFLGGFKIINTKV